jgi:hypothetical protein
MATVRPLVVLDLQEVRALLRALGAADPGYAFDQVARMRITGAEAGPIVNALVLAARHADHEEGIE